MLQLSIVYYVMVVAEGELFISGWGFKFFKILTIGRAKIVTESMGDR